MIDINEEGEGGFSGTSTADLAKGPGQVLGDKKKLKRFKDFRKKKGQTNES